MHDGMPLEVPEDLRYAASRLSWDDVAKLLCMFEGWMTEAHHTPAVRAKIREQADRLRELVRTLPYDWQPPPVEDHDVMTALAAMLRTGTMPPPLRPQGNGG